jgi:hypothetical protein
MSPEEKKARLPTRQLRQTITLGCLIILAMAGAISISVWFDTHRSKQSATIQEEKLYVSASAARRLSLGFNGLVADWYWMRSLQYVGNKIVNFPGHLALDNLSQLDLKLLAPLLDTTVTLDPQFMEPYQYAAVVLPEVDVTQAIRIIKKGIEANPDAWSLHHQLGYIYWQQGNFHAAAEAYGKGAALAGAPPWMEAMKARMATEGGSRATGREIYTRMFEQSGDPQVKEMARLRLLQLESLDQRDVLRRLLTEYQTKTGRCLTSWREAGSVLRTLRMRLDATGAPLDPTAHPYRLLTSRCDVGLDPESPIPDK